MNEGYAGKTVRSFENACHTDKALYKSMFTFTFTLPLLYISVTMLTIKTAHHSDFFLNYCSILIRSGRLNAQLSRFLLQAENTVELVRMHMHILLEN